MTAFTEMDRETLRKLSTSNFGCAVKVENCFFGGTEPEPFGFVPRDWNGRTLTFKYKQ